MSRAMLALVLAAAVASPAPCEVGPRSVVGVAEVRVTSSSGTASTRLVFAAAVNPPVLRVEIVRAGQVVAIAWSEPEALRIFVPGQPALLFEGAPTRESMSRALGIPFCPEEIIFALRAGSAPEPRCGATPEVLRRGDRVVGLVSEGADGRKVRVTFSRFLDGWPRRAELASGEESALVSFGAVTPREVPPAPLAAEVLAGARRVEAEDIAAAVGLDPDRP